MDTKAMFPPLGTIITPFSPEAVGGSQTGINSTSWLTQSTSTAWLSANLAIYVPFWLVSPVVIKRFAVLNGSTASGNFDVGIYSADGTKIISTGATAQSGTSAIQQVDTTDTLLGTGLFYLAMSMDNTTGTVAMNTPSNPFTYSGILQQASAYTLPATAAFAAGTSWTSIPIFGAAIVDTI